MGSRPRITGGVSLRGQTDACSLFWKVECKPVYSAIFSIRAGTKYFHISHSEQVYCFYLTCKHFINIVFTSSAGIFRSSGRLTFASVGHQWTRLDRTCPPYGQLSSPQSHFIHDINHHRFIQVESFSLFKVRGQFVKRRQWGQSVVCEVCADSQVPG